MFTGARGAPEKLCLALVPCSYVLRMIVRLAYRSKASRRCPLISGHVRILWDYTFNLKYIGFLMYIGYGISRTEIIGDTFPPKISQSLFISIYRTV